MPETADAPGGTTAAAAFRALRARQWTKNALLFAALVFSFEFRDPNALLRCLAGFFCFSLVSSCGYIFNDIRDREADALHPRKRLRPIASGALSVGSARLLLVFLGLAGMGGAWALSPAFAVITALYLANTLFYSLFLKHLVILDVMGIAAGFLWRAVAGAVVIDVHISEWLLLCTAFLALFLGFNKRRGELASLQEDAASHRKNLGEYTLEMLDQCQAVTTSGTVISYALYTILASPLVEPWLLLTLPHVLYGIFRYTYLVQVRGGGESPEEILLKDTSIRMTCVLYVATVVAVLVICPPAG